MATRSRSARLPPSAPAHGWLGVTSVEEGVAARAVCPAANILVIGGIFPGQAAAVIAHRLTPVAWDPTHFDELASAARAGTAEAAPDSIPVHLEIDTGMSRQGVSLEDLPAVVARFASGSPFALQAVMTHLYASDETAAQATASQLARLDQALSRLRLLLPASQLPQWLSVGASAALLGGTASEIAAIAASHNLVPMLRLGLALYGIDPAVRTTVRLRAGTRRASSPIRKQLKPVLAWKTRVVSVRNILAGTEVGYNGTFVAPSPCAWRSSLAATPTVSIAASETASACSSAASAPRSSGASAWTRQCWT